MESKIQGVATMKPAAKNPIKCTICGRTLKSIRHGVSGDDGLFICNRCYLELLYPSHWAGDMESLDVYAPLDLP